MAKMKHITKNRFDKTCQRIFEIQSGLNGLGSLFESQGIETHLSPSELFGVGQLIKILAHDLSIQEDILRCGYDSRAVTKK